VAVGVCAYLAGRYVRDTHFLVAPVDARQDWPLAFAYTASVTTVMVALAFASPRLQVPFAHPIVRRLADISYGVFLIHVVIIWYLLGRFSLAEDGSLGTFATLAVVVVPLSILYGYVSARFLEQPIRRWAHRFGRRAQAGSGPSSASGAPSRAATGP
jgi:peptidoglycan/LPS O-acetylase OafA/YrhL